MQQSNSVIDSSYIDRRFQHLGVVGKGRDSIYDITSTITLVRERSQTSNEETNVDDGLGKTYALQIYHALSINIFYKKVNQLQIAMTENITNLHTRIMLLGQNKVNNSTFDLYVVYDVDKLMDKTLQQEIQSRKNEKAETKFKLFSEKEAQELLTFFAQNIFLQGRYTSEFLDIAPQNILLNSQALPYHQKYVATNFGINYYGTKFYRRYTHPSDPFFEEPINEKSLPQIVFTYAFQAALVALQSMIGFDSKDLYREDKFNESFLINLISFITAAKSDQKQDSKVDPKADPKQNPAQDPKQDHKDSKEQEPKDKGSKYEKRKEEIYKNFPSISKKLEFPQITSEFSEILRKLFSTDQSKRSVFLQLIQYPNNLFELEFPLLSKKYSWLVPGVIKPENKGTYIGMGKPLVKEEEFKEEAYKKLMDQRQQTATQDGCGQCLYQEKELENNRYGCWKQGQPHGIGCLEIKSEHSTSYIMGNWDSPNTGSDMIIQEMDKYVYIGQIDDQFLPNGEGRLMKVNPLNSQLRLGRIPVYSEGIFENGSMKSGKMWFKDGNYFEGTFLENLPLNGAIFYKEHGHKFEGNLNKGQRVFGTLNYPNGVTFDGDFENDQIKSGMLLYPDISTYEGSFKNNMRHGAGVYTYADDCVKYEGDFKKNQMHGVGKFIVKNQDGTESSYPVQHDYGKLLTTLPIEVMNKLQEKKASNEETSFNQDTPGEVTKLDMEKKRNSEGRKPEVKQSEVKQPEKVQPEVKKDITNQPKKEPATDPKNSQSDIKKEDQQDPKNKDVKDPKKEDVQDPKKQESVTNVKKEDQQDPKEDDAKSPSKPNSPNKSVDKNEPTVSEQPEEKQEQPKPEAQQEQPLEKKESFEIKEEIHDEK